MPPCTKAERCSVAPFVLIKLKVGTRKPIPDWTSALQARADQAEREAPSLAQQLLFHSHSEAALRHPESSTGGSGRDELAHLLSPDCATIGLLDILNNVRWKRDETGSLLHG